MLLPICNIITLRGENCLAKIIIYIIVVDVDHLRTAQNYTALYTGRFDMVLNTTYNTTDTVTRKKERSET